MITPPGVEDERRRLSDEKKRIESEYDALVLRHKAGELSDEEFNRMRHALEREFVEIMDRISQMDYLMGK